MKRTRKLASVFLTLTLVLTLLPTAAMAEPEPEPDYVAEVNGTKFTSVQNAIQSIPDRFTVDGGGSGTVKLLKNVVVKVNDYDTKNIAVYHGRHITLDLNGYGILMEKADHAIRVEKDSSLELVDTAVGDAKLTHYISLDVNGRGIAVTETQPESGEEGKDYITVVGGYVTGGSASSYGGGVYLEGNAEFTMSTGTICGCLSGNYGGGVFVSKDGSFTMNAGTIKNNAASKRGGGVYVVGKFTMDGTSTEISGNTAEYGGGVAVGGHAVFSLKSGKISDNIAAVFGGGVYTEGPFTMEEKDAEISGNNAVSYGGGVFVNTGSNAEMKNGAIKNNSSYHGGGVFVNSGGTFNMTGANAAISGNTAGGFGGGVGIQNDAASKFVMTAGTVSGNSAASAGGGVSVGDSAAFVLENGTISGNTTMGYGGGVYTGATSVTEMSGGTISGNNAANLGGGIWFNGAFEVSGAAEITGNVNGGAMENGTITGGTSGNVNAMSAITVAGTLSAGAKIGMALMTFDAGQFVPADGVIAQGKTAALTNDDLKFFSCDIEGYRIVLDDGKAAFENTATRVVIDSVVNKTLTYSLANVPSDTLLIAAWYNGSGKMLGMTSTRVSEGKTVGATLENVGSGAAEYKLILVDQSFAPICKQASRSIG